jgi:hypothetical protein
MVRTLLVGVALIGALLPGRSLAQAVTQPLGAAPLIATEPPVDEIERGFYLGADVGLAFVGKLPAASGTPAPSAWGAMLRLEVGYDIGRYVTVSAFGAFVSYRAGSDYIGYSSGVSSGDSSELIPGLAVRVNAIGFPDGQGVQRSWLYAKAGVGWAFFEPGALYSAAPATSSYSSFYAFGGIGFQYYTHLRHFSIGIEADATVLGKSSSWGFLVTPNIRYAF